MANISSGHEMLRYVGENLLDKTSLEEPFPSNSTACLSRSGKLSCSDNDCSFVFYPLFWNFRRSDATIAELMTAGPEGNSGTQATFEKNRHSVNEPARFIVVLPAKPPSKAVVRRNAVPPLASILRQCDVRVLAAKFAEKTWPA